MKVAAALGIVAALAVSVARSSVPVDYRMHRRDSRWLVYDVLVEGVSLVGNYRAQFNTVICTKSYAELIRRMKTHSAG